jgi:hypothetical protein
LLTFPPCLRQLGTLSSGAGYAGLSTVSNYGGSSASQSNYSASSTNYPSTPPRPAHTYTSSSSPSNAYNPTSTLYFITPHSTSSSASVQNTPAPGPMLPRPLYSYGSSWEWDSQSGESTDEEQASIPALLGAPLGGAAQAAIRQCVVVSFPPSNPFPSPSHLPFSPFVPFLPIAHQFPFIYQSASCSRVSMVLTILFLRSPFAGAPILFELTSLALFYSQLPSLLSESLSTRPPSSTISFLIYDEFWPCCWSTRWVNCSNSGGLLVQRCWRTERLNDCNPAGVYTFPSPHPRSCSPDLSH